MAAHNELGKWGEELALRHLTGEGYTILERDYKSGKRDIDLIAVAPDGATLVFVEVKTRSSDDITTPEQAVDRKKMRSIGLAANAFIKSRNDDRQPRFDVIAIVGDGHEPKRLTHIEGAFNPLLL